jgi:hypothetical protein
MMAADLDFYIGATHVIIKDDCCCSPDEVDRILDRISEKASRAIYAEMITKEEAV